MNTAIEIIVHYKFGKCIEATVLMKTDHLIKRDRWRMTKDVYYTCETLLSSRRHTMLIV